jgi:hypothetical protein
MVVSNPAFLMAVVDILLPGGALAHGTRLPAASDIGIDVELARWLGDERPGLATAVALIAEEAGGENAFAFTNAASRASAVGRAQDRDPTVLASLISACLTSYYEQPRVIEAFGWPSRPPQPLGHELAPFDRDLLAPVRRRGPIWRES